ncbi:hypothetical protein A3D78_00400 [Candidatus Gottesmanbacteria bacterium RIFCSPHIGHO2_02_FULL_39_14]|uniref:LemA family protein n=1 Tax=Candidatus Gottesmanbacteria bacterium RIFCSPHIGHO2_02_FULL_39_14 TaxID=1798383 RepID=A0A1F5ZU73_9BACT|nr:MAG: hypothetical protein A3D78_00400 [Candidatus Gottesmanbacteria bacterium RIFCSPHIGHO2_02_FULL_39_14]
MLIGLLLVLGLIVLYIWSVYNNLIALKVRVKEAWSQIDVQLNRRADLIPNLVKTVKSYAKHEKELFENVTKARSSLLSAATPVEKAKAEGELQKVLKSLFAVAENYPQLRASETYLQLQKELSDTEDKVSFARQFYNQIVSDFNAKIQMFPQMIIAQQMKLTPAEFFKTVEESRKKVTVDL